MPITPRPGPTLLRLSQLRDSHAALVETIADMRLDSGAANAIADAEMMLHEVARQIARLQDDPSICNRLL